MSVGCLEFLPDGVEEGDDVGACGDEAAIGVDEVEAQDGGVTEGGETVVSGSVTESIEECGDAGVVGSHGVRQFAPKERANSGLRRPVLRQFPSPLGLNWRKWRSVRF